MAKAQGHVWRRRLLGEGLDEGEVARVVSVGVDDLVQVLAAQAVLIAVLHETL